MNDERDRETPNSAAEWFVRIDATARDPEVDAQLADWLGREPDNEAALARCASAVAIARRLADHPELTSALGATAASAGGTRLRAARRPVLAGFGVAAVAAVVALAVLYVPAPSTIDSPPRASRATAIVAGGSAQNPTIMLPGRVVVDANSLAVLPFASAASGAGGDPLAAQIEALVIAELSSVPGIYVVSGAAVQPFASGDFSPAEVGVLLGTRGIVRGTVARLDDRVRVHVELDDAAADRVVWSADYERPLDELRAMQIDLVDAVATALVDPALRRDGGGSARDDSSVASFGEPPVNQ